MTPEERLTDLANEISTLRIQCPPPIKYPEQIKIKAISLLDFIPMRRIIWVSKIPRSTFATWRETKTPEFEPIIDDPNPDKVLKLQISQYIISQNTLTNQQPLMTFIKNEIEYKLFSESVVLKIIESFTK